MFQFNKSRNGYQVKFDNKYTLESTRFGMKWLKEEIKLINSTGYMSEELGRELERLFEDVGYVGDDRNFTHLGYNAGIHLTGHSLVTPEYINDIFANGLINNGHAMSGGFVTNAPSLDLTVTSFDSVIFAVNHLKNGHKYKGSKAAVLIKYPHDLEQSIQALEYFDGESYRINPNFIYGIVMLGEDGVGDIIRNPNYNISEGLQKRQ